MGGRKNLLNIMKLIRSFVYAWNGIRSCFASEPNFRIHAFLAIVALIFSILLNISAIEWIAVGFCIAFVITMEMLNTAIEKLCDVVHQDVHPGIKKVKDMAAGAVLVSAIFSMITGLIIFLPKIILYFKSL
jgi:diacylglycerol kinase